MQHTDRSTFWVLLVAAIALLVLFTFIVVVNHLLSIPMTLSPGPIGDLVGNVLTDF